MGTFIIVCVIVLILCVALLLSYNHSYRKEIKDLELKYSILSQCSSICTDKIDNFVYMLKNISLSSIESFYSVITSYYSKHLLLADMVWFDNLMIDLLGISDLKKRNYLNSILDNICLGDEIFDSCLHRIYFQGLLFRIDGRDYERGMKYLFEMILLNPNTTHVEKNVFYQKLEKEADDFIKKGEISYEKQILLEAELIKLKKALCPNS